MTTIIPEYANLIWVSENHIHIAVPTHTGEPYIISHHRTVVGLAECLGIMCRAFEAKSALPEGEAKKPPAKPQAHAAVRRPPALYTEEQRNLVRELMKKQGLI